MPPTGGGGGNTFSAASPGAIGGTTSNTAQFTNVAIGASVPPLDGTIGDLTLAAGFATGGSAVPALAGDSTVARGASNSVGKLNIGTGNRAVGLNTGTDSTGGLVLTVNRANFANAYLTLGAAFTFSTLPAAASGIEGSVAVVTDSTTVVWGATVTGGGSNHILAYCDGTNWTVAAK